MSYNGCDFWDAGVAMTASAGRLHSAASITSPYDGNPLDLTIFVSCYNEEAFIEGTLKTIAEAMRAIGKTYEIIVIDDCSKDGSALSPQIRR